MYLDWFLHNPNQRCVSPNQDRCQARVKFDARPTVLQSDTQSPIRNTGTDSDVGCGSDWCWEAEVVDYGRLPSPHLSTRRCWDARPTLAADSTPPAPEIVSFVLRP